MEIGRSGPFKYKPRATKLEIDDTVNGKPMLQMITELAAYRHTQAEAAGLLGCSESCFERFLRDHPEAREAWKDGRRISKASLRRMLWSHAKSDPSTARFLAKNMLKMTDGGEKANSPQAAADEGVDVSRLPKEKLIARIIEFQRAAIVDNSANTAKATGKGVIKRG